MGGTGDEMPRKSRRRFGYKVRQARARPSNTTVRNLLLDSRYFGAVLRFLKSTKVGRVKEGTIMKGI